MKITLLPRLGIYIVSMMLVLLPVLVSAETGQAKANPPPITQPLVTEGLFAGNLASALELNSTTDAVAAESALGDSGIFPRNGWVADYPVTPDIIAEVRQSVATAADEERLSFTRDVALKRFDDAVADIGLMVRTYTGGESVLDKPISCDNYPNPAMVNSVYSGEGPPIVTYYCPPPDYYYLYSWVPYPFWWSDFWFPGFFILRDFHRHVSIRGHFVLCSNHFNDLNRHRMFRIDPVDRFHGKTFAGIGVKSSRGFISTGAPRSTHTIFNAPRGGTLPVNRGAETPALRGVPSAAPATRSGGGGGTHGSGGGGMHGSGGGGMRGSGGGGMHGGGNMR
jgi:uncharacterized membrane protein YgcG